MTTPNNNHSAIAPSNQVHLEAIYASFRPADSPETATHWFSTEEIYDAIRRVDPATELTKEQVHNTMLLAGFRYAIRPGSAGIDFRWMLIAKE